MQSPALRDAASSRSCLSVCWRAVRRLAACFVLVAGASAPAMAATFTVGPGGSCTHTSLQAALDSAANNSGADEVRIVRTAPWTAIQVSTNTNQDVEIVGGWADCSSQQPTGKTTLDGKGGQARSVIALRGNGHFTLRNLRITGGDQAGDDDGGGVHFLGGGGVEIVDSEINGNAAEDGGGIYAQGTSATAKLILGENVLVVGNTARRHGGGVAAQNLEMTMVAPGSTLWSNIAGDSGGGLIVASGDFPAYAYIGSSGFGGLGAIYDNRAAKGGGVAVLGGGGNDAGVQLFSTSSSTPLPFSGNRSTQRGGAIDLQPDSGLFDGFARATAMLVNVDVRENQAPVGAAINLSYSTYNGGLDSFGGDAYFNAGGPRDLHPSAASCPFGAPCGHIRGNRTTNTTGAVVHFSEDAYFSGSRITIEGNEGGWLMYLSGEEGTALALNNSLIIRNTVQNALIRKDENVASTFAALSLNYLTISGNTIGANGVLSINEDLLLTRSLVDQPGKALFATDVGASGGTRDIQYVLMNEPGGPVGTTLATPRFVDAARGDYMPRAGSLAVDRAPALAGFAVDLYSHNRTVDLPLNPNDAGASDIGALEREYLQPLVLNSDFDVDLNQWEQLAPSSRDAVQNASGAPGSGSLTATVAADQTRVAVRRQCVHLPGPGLYALDGWGRVTGVAPFAPPNRAWLDWELRFNAGYNGCSNGPPAATGSLQLASTSTWTTAAVPAFIDVPAASWGANASLTVTLVVQNGSPIAPAADGTTTPGAVLGGPQGWFDGITLSTDYDDTIFRNGFE